MIDPLAELLPGVADGPEGRPIVDSPSAVLETWPPIAAESAAPALCVVGGVE
jgi:hypothetical protein